MLYDYLTAMRIVHWQPAMSVPLDVFTVVQLVTLLGIVALSILDLPTWHCSCINKVCHLTVTVLWTI